MDGFVAKYGPPPSHPQPPCFHVLAIQFTVSMLLLHVLQPPFVLVPGETALNVRTSVLVSAAAVATTVVAHGTFARACA